MQVPGTQNDVTPDDLPLQLRNTERIKQMLLGERIHSLVHRPADDLPQDIGVAIVVVKNGSRLGEQRFFQQESDGIAVREKSVHIIV